MERTLTLSPGEDEGVMVPVGVGPVPPAARSTRRAGDAHALGAMTVPAHVRRGHPGEEAVTQSTSHTLSRYKDLLKQR